MFILILWVSAQWRRIPYLFLKDPPSYSPSYEFYEFERESRTSCRPRHHKVYVDTHILVPFPVASGPYMNNVPPWPYWNYWGPYSTRHNSHALTSRKISSFPNQRQNRMMTQMTPLDLRTTEELSEEEQPQTEDLEVSDYFVLVFKWGSDPLYFISSEWLQELPRTAEADSWVLPDSISRDAGVPTEITGHSPCHSAKDCGTPH